MIKILCLLSVLFVFDSKCRAAVPVDSGAVLVRSAVDSSRTHVDWALGLSLGTPAGLNAIGQVGGEKTFGRLSGFMLPTLAGLQLEYGYYLTRTRRTNVAISAMAAAMDGTTHQMLGGTTHYSWAGVGAAVSTTLSGFFLEAGIALGSGEYTSTSSNWFSGASSTTHTPIESPQFMAQIGYLYEFGR